LSTNGRSGSASIEAARRSTHADLLPGEIALLVVGQLLLLLRAQLTQTDDLKATIRVVGSLIGGATVAIRIAIFGRLTATKAEHLDDDDRGLCGGGVLGWRRCLLHRRPGRVRGFGQSGDIGAWIVGTPVVLPCAWILAALTICRAARLTLPEERMPASPASMVPSGAIKSTLPGGKPGIGLSVAMPAPDDGTFGDRGHATIIVIDSLRNGPGVSFPSRSAR
jgi:hypothetical protein